VSESNNYLLQAIRADYICAGILAYSCLYLVLLVFRLPTVMFYGMIGGVGSAIHMPILTFAGALLGRFVFAPRFGKDKWRSYVPVLIAGYAAGMGLVALGATAIALIVKSVNQIQY
jgi:hypothetical protein